MSEPALSLTQEGDWTWLSGDTYPHKTFIKSMGGRWSKKRQAWYFTRAVPDLVRQLVDTANAKAAASPTGGDTPAPAKQQLGKALPREAFMAADKVFAAQDAANTTRTVLQERWPDSQKYQIDVLAEMVRVAVLEFLRCHTHPTRESIRTILERKFNAHPYNPIKLIGEQPVRDLVTQIVEELFALEPTATPQPVTPPPAPRIEPPPPPTAAAEVKRLLPQAEAVANSAYPVRQYHIGRIEAVGVVQVFGLALHDNALIYLDMAGSQTAVEAVWARLRTSKGAALCPPDGEETISLSAPVKAEMSRWQRKLTNGLEHCVLLVKPEDHEYLVKLSDAQITAATAGRIAAFVRVPTFPTWEGWLWEEGLRQKLIQPCVCAGGVEVYALTRSRDRWTASIQAGLKAGSIRLP